MRTVDFLDALKRRHEVQSDYRLSKIMKVGQTTISSYRVGRSCFDADMAIKVAGLLDMPPGYVLACIEEERAERTKRPQVRKAWHEVAKALAPAVMAAFVGIGSAVIPAPVQASNGQEYTLSAYQRSRVSTRSNESSRLVSR